MATNTDSVEFVLPEIPEHDPLTPYERSRVEAGKEDSEMRRQAAEAQRGTSSVDANMKARPRSVVPLDNDTIYQFTLSPSIHAERVFALAPDEHDEVRGYLKDASDFLHSTRTTLEKIDTAYKDLMQDKSLTADARSIKLEAATSTAFTTAYAKRGAALEAIAKKIEFTEGALNSPLTAQAATPRSTELRSVLREMKPGDRSALIREAISAQTPSVQQTELLHSVLGAHHLMIGISEQEQNVHVRAYNERTQPHIQRRLDLLKKSLAIVGSIAPETLKSQFEGSMRSKFSRATSIRGISDKAAAALAAINAKE